MVSSACLNFVRALPRGLAQIEGKRRGEHSDVNLDYIPSIALKTSRVQGGYLFVLRFLLGFVGSI